MFLVAVGAEVSINQIPRKNAVTSNGGPKPNGLSTKRALHFVLRYSGGVPDGRHCQRVRPRGASLFVVSSEKIT